MTVSLEKVSHRAGDKWIFRDLSAEIGDSEIFGVLGLNGAGKSTLMRMIAGLSRHGSGEIRISGEPDAVSRKRSSVYVGHRGRDSFFSRIAGADAEHPGDRAERVRLALRSESRCVILDSVLDGLDAENLVAIQQAIRERAAEDRGCTIISGTERRQIYSNCDRVAILHGGEFVQTGPPAEIYRHPNNSLVARLGGYANLIEARRLSSSNDREPEYVTIRGEHRITAGKTDKKDLAPINQNANLLIRPEDISISFGASFPEDNVLKAVVTDVRFLGPITKVFLESKGLKLEALVLRLVGLGAGDECLVALPPDRIRVLKN